MNHRIGRTVFALLVGVIVAVLSYRWVTDPSGRVERAKQIQVVEDSREILVAAVDSGPLEIVDPVDPDRKVGKVYVYREGDSWAVSGYYRRDEDDSWHPYLMSLEADHSLRLLKLQDSHSGLLERASVDPLLEISP